MKSYVDFHRQSGLSLIELMIAGVLSLILMAGVFKLFIGSKVTYLMTDSMGHAQENGRFALDVLTRYARIAGYSELSAATSNPAPFASVCASVECTQNDAGLNDSDRLAIRFKALKVPNNVDCNGNVVAEETIMQNVFWIQNDANGSPALYCQGYNFDTSTWLGTAQAYVSGIDNLQVQYGIADPSTGNVTRYVNATNVTDWALIRAVRVAVLAQSGQTDDSNFGDKSYVLLDSEPLDFSDGQPRYIFATTLFLENITI